MKENAKRRFLSLSAAVLALLSMQSGMITASAEEEPLTNDPFAGSDWNTVSCVPFAFDDFGAVSETVEAFGLQTFDYTGANGVDADDVSYLESVINTLYAETGYNGTNGKRVQYIGKLRVDINGDGMATPEDYCLLMRYVQNDFTFTIDTESMSATITSYTGKDKPDLVIPTEVFYKGHIFPVMGIRENAFSGHTELKSVTMRDYVQPLWHSKDNPAEPLRNHGKVTASTCLKIGKNAFADCTALTTVYLPQNTILADYAVFTRTPFSKTAYSVHDGICYLTDSDSTTVIAYALTNSRKHIINYGTHSLELADGTTAFSKLLAKQLDPESLYNIRIPDSLVFIDDDALRDFTGLQTLNNHSFKDCSADVQALVKRYLAAFNNTQFIADITKEKIAKYVYDIVTDKDYDGTERSAALLFAKKIARETEYSEYYSVSKEPNTAGVYTISPQFDLYLNDDYYINDLCRGSNNSASAVFLLGDGGKIPAYTQCEGFALATSLVLDTLGIRNFFCGQNLHALNIIYIDGRWYMYDMSGVSSRAEEDVIADDVWELSEDQTYLTLKKAGIFGCYSGIPFGKDTTWISLSRQFELYPSSCTRQQTMGYPRVILNQPADEYETLNPYILRLREYAPETAEEEAVFSGAPVTMVRESLAPNDWHILNQVYYYIGADGDFLRNGVTPDGYRTDKSGAYIPED